MSYKFYQNTECEYFPCHKGIKDFNCKFCFCPLYHMKNCEGNYLILENGIKDCSKCDIIHKKDIGYDFVIKKIIENNKK